MKKLALIALPLVLASCTMAGPTEGTYTLAPQAIVKPAGPVYAPAGTAKINEALGVTRTTITLTGMAPYAIYVAHYHKMGTAAPVDASTNAAPAASTTANMTDAAGTTATATTAGTGDTMAAGTEVNTTVTMAPVTNTASNACSSDGPAIMESRMIAQATADGKVTLSGIVPTAAIRDAAYINVHHGRDFNGALADGGVVCTPITMTMR